MFRIIIVTLQKYHSFLGNQAYRPVSYTHLDVYKRQGEIRRPELSLFNAQGVGLQVQEKALNVRHLPQFGLFVQGAYGNPGLNMLKNEFSPYYIAGVRLSWNFGSLYTLKNDRKVIENKRRQLDNNRDVFLFNTRLEMTQQDQAIQSLEKQMQDDDEIIRLRTNIRKSAEAKVANEMCIRDSPPTDDITFKSE